jgi:hypothetical protein
MTIQQRVVARWLSAPKLRCRVTEAKVNLKGKYDELECGACGSEEETQQHIIKRK